MRFLRRIREAAKVEDLEVASKKWDSFDAALAAGLMKMASGAIARELILYREDRLREGKVPTGASILFMVLNRYAIERSQAAQVDITTLLAHKFHGNLEEYLDGLDTKLSTLTKEPDRSPVVASLRWANGWKRGMTGMSISCVGCIT